MHHIMHLKENDFVHYSILCNVITAARNVFENDCLFRYLLFFLFNDESSLEKWSRATEPDALLQICILKLVDKRWLIFFTREVRILEISIQALLSKTWPTITRSQYLCFEHFVRLNCIIVRANRDDRKSSKAVVWWGVPSSLTSLFGLERIDPSTAYTVNISLHLKINLELNSDLEQLIDDTVCICSGLPDNITAIDALDFSGSSSRLDFPILSSFLGKLTHIQINNLRLDNCVGICTIDGMDEHFYRSRKVCEDGEQANNGDRTKVYMNGCWALTKSSYYAPPFWIDLELPMQLREIAQVVIISGVHKGEWVYCTVVRVHPMVIRDTAEVEERSITRRIHEHHYDILVHPTEDFQRAVGFSGRIAEYISRVHLRRVTPIQYDLKIQIN